MSVPVRVRRGDGRAERRGAPLQDTDRRLLAAQIVWTLNQINLRVRITVRGAPLLPDDPDVLPFSNFSQYDPSVPNGAMTDLYGVRGGKVQRIEGLDGASDIAARPLKNSMLTGYPAKSFAVNLRGDSGAIVTTYEGDDVVATSWLDSTDKSDPLRTIRTQGRVLRPSYDNHDSLWILDRADATPRLRVRDRGRQGRPR